MRWIVWGVGVLVVVAVAVWAVGTTLPVAHSATVARRVAGTPAEVWEVLTTPEAFAGWRPGVRSVERLPDRDGLPVWREVSRTGSLTLEVVEWEPPGRLVMRIADEDLPFGGTWTYRLVPEGEGTGVTVTENGEIYNPFFRFVSRFILGYDATMRSYLDGLEARMAAPGGDP